MDKGERIKNARLANGMTQEELAEKCGTTKQTIFKYENGIITNIPSDKLELMAEALNVSPEYILGWNTPEKKAISLSIPQGTDSIVFIEDDAMLPSGIKKGDMVFVNESAEINDGDIVAVTIDGKHFVRRIYVDEENEITQLLADSREFDPMVLIGSKPNYVNVLGKVFAFLSYL